MEQDLEIAGPARMEKRHFRIAYSFIIAVIFPIFLSATYLWFFAKDQYISSMSFSVRSESMQSATDLLGGLSSITGSSSSDVDILTQFIDSGDLLKQVDAKLNLKQIYSSQWPEDFLFSFNPEGKFEDLHKYWNKVTTTQTVNGIVTLTVRSYDPQVSYDIAVATYEACRQLIRDLSDEAHSDATRFSRDELQASESRLALAREALTTFRLEAQIVDPNASLQAQMGILTELQTQLADSLVQKHLFSRTDRENDPRMNEVDRKISALRAQIDAEQEKFSRGGRGPGGEDYATLFAKYERLTSDLLFAEEAYRAAQLTHAAALADAKRTARYLVAHIQPTIPEKSLYPLRATHLMIFALFVTLLWSVGLLIYYSIRDRR